MQIRCFHCHKPYALGKEAVHAALDLITEQKLGHFNAACPHCGRVNRVSRNELIRAAPGWKEHTPAEPDTGTPGSAT